MPPTVDRYATDSWPTYHRQLTDIPPTYDRYSVEVRLRNIDRYSADSLSLSRPTGGRISTDSRPTVDRHSTACRSTVHRLSTDSRSTIDRLSIDYRPTIDRLSTDYRSTIDRYIDRLSTDIAVDIAVDITSPLPTVNMIQQFYILQISQKEELFLLIRPANDETFKSFRITVFLVSQLNCYYCGTKHTIDGGLESDWSSERC